MNGASILYMLFGAALVMAGVLVTALADRIRGLRAVREKSAAARTAIEVVEAPKAKRAPMPMPTMPVPERRKDTAQKLDATANEVITALTEAGFKKSVAGEAVWNCNEAERQTIETWTGAALRRAAGAS